MKIDGNEIKVGNILEINNKLWKVLKTQHTQPGKGGAYIQAELKEINEDQSKYLIENNDVIIQFYNEKPVSLQLQEQVVLTVLETEGVVKGQTAASSYKPAVLEKGIKTTVPQFIEVNDKIVVSTIDDTYIEKAK